MNGFLRGTVLAVLSGIALALAGCGGGDGATSGRNGGSMPRYVTDLLAEPGNTLIATVTAPQDSNLYGSFAGDNVSFVVLACYPTTDNNPRPDYSLWTTGKVVP